MTKPGETSRVSAEPGLALELATVPSARDGLARTLASDALAPASAVLSLRVVPVGTAPGSLLAAVLTHAKGACDVQGAPRLVLACDIDERGRVVEADVEVDDVARALALSGAACRLLVTKAQALRVRPALVLFPEIDVWTVFGLGDALDAAGVVGAVEEPALWRGRLEPLAEALFRFVCGNGYPLGGWRLVAATARGALRAGAPDTIAAWQLTFARDVARRHQGETALLSWDDARLAELDSDLRLEAIAHLVQSASDSDLFEVEDYVERAVSSLDQLPGPSTAATKVRGAIGRALAAAGQWEPARETLERAVGEWARLERMWDASRALCELLRVLGIQRASERLASLEDREVADVLAVVSPESSAYVKVALGRAWVQAGAPERGLSILESQELEGIGDVEEPRHRWRALALDALGRREDADDVRATQGGALARLDSALRDDRAVVAAFEELLEAPNDGEELRRLLDRLSPDRSWRERPDRALLQRAMFEWRY